MPAEGLEPTRSCDHWILSPARLPVPPRRRRESPKIRVHANVASSMKIVTSSEINRESWARVVAVLVSSTELKDRRLAQAPLQRAQLQRLQTSRRSEHFAQNNCAAQPGRRTQQCGDVCLAARWLRSRLSGDRVCFRRRFDGRRRLRRCHSLANVERGL